MTRGDKQAEKLKDVVKSTLGTDIKVQIVVEKIPADMRDLKETTNSEDIVKSISQLIKEDDTAKFKVSNIR